MNSIKKIIIGFVLILLAIVLSTTCSKDPEIISKVDTSGVFKPTPYKFIIPKYFPTKIYIPENNPLTIEGIELGRYLFYDGRLAGRTHPDSLMSCGTCHIQKNAFECGIDHPKYTNGRPFGVTGILTPHYMLPFINLAWNPNTLLWNGKFKTVEESVYMGIIAPHEMKSDTNRSKAMIQSIAIYPPMFKKAFGSDVVTFANIQKAIAQFVYTLISADSKFDRYMRGEEQLNPAELRGLVLFTTEQGADCFHCHGGNANPLFTTNLFYNNAKDNVFNDPRDRFAITADPQDHGAYKATTLRNIEVTGPYMHDGRFKTLDEVIEFYSTGLVMSPYVHPLMHKLPYGGADLTPSQKQDLKAFLLTLTDQNFLINPNFSKPAGIP